MRHPKNKGKPAELAPGPKKSPPESHSLCADKASSGNGANKPQASSGGGAALASSLTASAKKQTTHTSKKRGSAARKSVTASLSAIPGAGVAATASPPPDAAVAAKNLCHGFVPGSDNKKTVQLFNLDPTDIELGPHVFERVEPAGLLHTVGGGLNASPSAREEVLRASFPLRSSAAKVKRAGCEQLLAPQPQTPCNVMSVLVYRDCYVKPTPNTLIEKGAHGQTPLSGRYMHSAQLEKGFRIKIAGSSVENDVVQSGAGSASGDRVATDKASDLLGQTDKPTDMNSKVVVEVEIIGEGWTPEYCDGIQTLEATYDLFNQLDESFSQNVEKMSGRFSPDRAKWTRYCRQKSNYQALLAFMDEMENKITMSAMPDSIRLNMRFLQLEDEIFAYLESLNDDDEPERAIFAEHVSKLYGFVAFMQNTHTVFLNECSQIRLCLEPSSAAAYLTASADATTLIYSNVPENFMLEKGTGSDFYLKLQKGADWYYCDVINGKLFLVSRRPQAQFYFQHNAKQPGTYLLVCKGWTLARHSNVASGYDSAAASEPDSTVSPGTFGLTAMVQDYLGYAQPVTAAPGVTCYESWKTRLRALVNTIDDSIFSQVQCVLRTHYQAEVPQTVSVPEPNSVFPAYGFTQPLTSRHAVMFAEHVLPEIREASKRDLVYVIGTTGAGKSTFINYMCGFQFKQDAELGYYDVVDPTQRHAKIGRPTDSETFYPSVYTDHKGNTFVDTPGFGETRASHKDIGALSMHVLQQAANKIRAIVVMIPIAELDHQKGKGLSQLYANLQHFYQFGELERHTTGNVFFIVNLKRTASTQQTHVLTRLQNYKAKIATRHQALSDALDRHKQWWGDPGASENALDNAAIITIASLAKHHEIDVPIGKLSSAQAKQIFQGLCRRREAYAQSLKVMALINKNNLLIWDITDKNACRRGIQEKLAALSPNIFIDKKKLQFASATPEQVMLEKTIVDYIDEKRRALQTLLNKQREQQQILDAQKRLPQVETDKVNQQLHALLALSDKRLNALTEYTCQTKLFDLFLEAQPWSFFKPFTTSRVIVGVEQGKIATPYTSVRHRTVVDATPRNGLLPTVDMGDGLTLHRQHYPPPETLERLNYPRGLVTVYRGFVGPEYKADTLFRSIEGAPRVGELWCLKVDDPRQKMNFNDAKKRLALLFRCWEAFVEQCAYLAVLDDAQPDTQPWSALRANIAEWQTWLEEGTDKTHGMSDRKLLEQLITVVQQGQQWVRDLQQLLDNKSQGYSDLSERLETKRREIIAAEQPIAAQAREAAQTRNSDQVRLEIDCLEGELQKNRHRYAETYCLLAGVEGAFFTDKTKRSVFFAFMRTCRDAYGQYLAPALPHRAPLTSLMSTLSAVAQRRASIASLTRLSLFQSVAVSGGAAGAAAAAAPTPTQSSAQALLNDIQAIITQEEGCFTVAHVDSSRLRINCAPPEGQSTTANYTQTMTRIAKNFIALCGHAYPDLKVTVAKNKQTLTLQGSKRAVSRLYKQLSELAGAPNTVWERNKSNQSDLNKHSSKSKSRGRGKKSKPAAQAAITCSMQ